MFLSESIVSVSCFSISISDSWESLQTALGFFDTTHLNDENFRFVWFIKEFLFVWFLSCPRTNNSVTVIHRSNSNLHRKIEWFNGTVANARVNATIFLLFILLLKINADRRKPRMNNDPFFFLSFFFYWITRSISNFSDYFPKTDQTLVLLLFNRPT